MNHRASDGSTGRGPTMIGPMTHLLNLLCGTFLVYASVTRGGLAVAHGFAYIARRSA
jgi:hypothetical protein